MIHAQTPSASRLASTGPISIPNHRTRTHAKTPPITAPTIIIAAISAMNASESRKRIIRFDLVFTWVMERSAPKDWVTTPIYSYCDLLFQRGEASGLSNRRRRTTPGAPQGTRIGRTRSCLLPRSDHPRMRPANLGEPSVVCDWIRAVPGGCLGGQLACPLLGNEPGWRRLVPNHDRTFLQCRDDLL